MAKSKGKVELKSPLYATGSGHEKVESPTSGKKVPNPLGYHTGQK